MKLCKPCIAATLILSILLMSVVCFATEGTQANTRTVPAIRIPTGTVTLDALTTAYNAGGRLEIMAGQSGYAQLGVSDVSGLTTSVIETAGSIYDGYTVSGTVTVATPTDGALYSVTFENLEITHIRTSSGKNRFILCAAVDNVKNAATSVTVWNETEGTADTVSDFSDLDFSVLSDENHAVTATFTKSVTSLTVDMGAFPSDTLIFAANTVNLSTNYNDAWTTTLAASQKLNLSAWGSNTVGCHGPFGIFSPNVSGTYRIYGLRYDQADNVIRPGYFMINDTQIVFNSAMPDNIKYSYAGSEAQRGTFWNDSGVTITLEAGKPYFFQVGRGGTSGSAALGNIAAVAFVPADKTAAAIQEFSFEPTNLNALCDLDFTKIPLNAHTVTIKDYTQDSANPTQSTVTVKPYLPQASVGMSGAESYSYTDIAGNIHTAGTVLDALASYDATIFTGKDALWDYQIYLNGKREYAPEKMTVKASDLIEIKKEELTASNFNPICLSDVRHTQIVAESGTGNMRFGVKTELVPSVLHSSTDASLCPYIGTKFAGYAVVNETGASEIADVAAGQKVYFENDVIRSVSEPLSGSTAFDYLHTTVALASKTPVTTVETAEGTQTVHDPYTVYTSNTSEQYDWSNAYWVNSSITDSVYVISDGNTHLIRTDGAALVKIIIVTYNESNSLNTVAEPVQKMLTVKEGIKLTLRDNQKAFVWKDTPYQGTTMKPMCTVIEN